MFMQSFENTDKQQQRLKSRQLAIERMNQAANLVQHRGNGSAGVDGAVVGEGEKPAAEAEAEAVTDDFASNLADAEKSPWKTNATRSPNTDDADGDQYRARTSVVDSASDFLRETERDYNRSNNHHSSPKSPPDQNPRPYSPQFSISSRATLSNLKGRLAEQRPVLSARQFLWDESSVVSNYTQRSTSGSADNNEAMLNLHDIKNSSNVASRVKDLERNGGRTTGGGRYGARWSALHGRAIGILPPLWGGGGGGGAGGEASATAEAARSGRHRDEEGHQLLNLASRRLSPIDSPGGAGRIENMAALRVASEFGEPIVTPIEEEEEDYSIPRDRTAPDGNDGRVFLGPEGDLSRDDEHYGMDDENYSRRRMMNHYRRAFKRPCILVGVVFGIVAIAYGARGLHSKMIAGAIGNIGRFEGNVSSAGSNWSEAVAHTDDDWAETFHPDKDTNENGNEDSSEEQAAALEVVASIESIDKELHKEKLPPHDADADGGESSQRGDGVGNDAHWKERFDHIRYTLVNRGASPPEVFADELSAQYAALAWLTKDDPRRLDPDSVYLGQRYGLAVLWFSTTGSGYAWHVPEHSGPKDKYGEDVGFDEEDVAGVYYDKNDEGDEWLDDDDGDDGIDHYADHDEWENGGDEEGDGGVERGENDGGRNLLEQDPDSWFRHFKWLTSDGICGWEGVTCHPPRGAQEPSHGQYHDGNVSRVELRRNNLRGLVPDEIYATLPYLERLDLSDNGLAGTLSDDVEFWTNLKSLNLTSNNIAGSLTGAVGELRNLKELHAANNLLDGSIPRAVGKLLNLKSLDLSGNTMRGTIPYEMGGLTRLGDLDLSHNWLVGPLPHEFSELKALVSLDVSHNELGGPMIVELSQITYLRTLRLNDNHFSGELPSEIGDLVHLEELRLNNNDFRGTLPGEISNLGGLDVLNIAKNHFQGEFPLEWTSMAALQELDISSNELIGEIPIFVDGMKNLHSLNAAHNDFSSTIPSELGKLYRLEYLYLDGNEFESIVPKELGELTNMKKMALHNNDLIGQIDDHICKLVDEMFLTQLSVDCGGEMPNVHCECCICHAHEPIVHLITEP